MDDVSDSEDAVSGGEENLTSISPSLERIAIGREEEYELDSEELKEMLSLLRRKGVYCYDYISSLEKLEETSLPQPVSIITIRKSN